jgi:two-component sensor histidine kinase
MLSHRVEALALIYDELMDPAQRQAREQVEAGAYLSRVASVITGIDGRKAVQLDVDCEPIELPVDPSARLGLLLTELLTNSLEHAFDGRDEGTVTVRLFRGEDGRVVMRVEDDGNGLPEGLHWPYDADTIGEQQAKAQTETGELDTTDQSGKTGLGGSIVRGLTQALGASLDIQSDDGGTRIEISLDPAELPGARG